MKRPILSSVASRNWLYRHRRGVSVKGSLRQYASVLALVVLSSSVSLAQKPEPPTPARVGIDEKLGERIPLDLQLVDETNQRISLRQLIDKPTVLTLNYFRCPGICTPMLTNLAGTLSKTDLEPGKDFQVLTVSFDVRDTPQIAAGKRHNYLKLVKRPFPPAAWRFLTGDDASTRALADAVGFELEKQGENYIHPGAIVMLSPEGIVTRYMYGISVLPADLQMAVGEASKGLVRPTISKALAFCYSYDPEGRTYVFNITRLAGSIFMIAAGVFAAVLVFKGRRRAA
jgi:protein SCO1/2